MPGQCRSDCRGRGIRDSDSGRDFGGPGKRPVPAATGTQRLGDSLPVSDDEPDLGDNKYLFKNIAIFKAKFEVDIQ